MYNIILGYSNRREYIMGEYSSKSKSNQSYSLVYRPSHVNILGVSELS